MQAYFVYDSKKSGSVTVSHLRFDEEPITSTYLISEATFVGVHQWGLMEKLDVLGVAGHGRTRPAQLARTRSTRSGTTCPTRSSSRCWPRTSTCGPSTPSAVARKAGIGGRINTVMQACFFAISGVLPLEEAMPRLTEAVRKSYGKRGTVVVERNLAAIDAATAELHQVPVPEVATSTLHRRPPVPEHVPDFVARVTGRMIAGEGDLLPVSALPVDGAFPTGTAAYEKRTIATKIPIWESDLCIDCGKCTIVCPHAAIRMNVFDPAENPDARATCPPRASATGRSPGWS